MSDLSVIKFLLDASHSGAESKFKNQIKSLKEENEILKNHVSDLETKIKGHVDRERELQQQLERQDKRASKNFDAYMRCSEKYTKLKQQFEEKELEAIRWEEHFNNAKMDYQCLKEQLAKKENEWNQLKFQVDVKDGENAELEKRIYELDGNGFCTGECWCCEYFKKSNDGYSVCTYKADQDKISFCIDKMEQVKTAISLYNKEHCFLSTEIDTCNKLTEIINDQINKLKKDNE